MKTTLLKRLIQCISPRLLINIIYYRTFRKPINWRNPQDINEKINWLKLYGDTSSWSIQADKYRVRSFVQECGLGDLLVKLYGKWDKAEDINWDSLPEKFVMKVNNGSGDVFVCHNKSGIDVNKQTTYFRALLNARFSSNNVELHYEKMKPCIIAEEMLDCTLQPIKTDTLIDYKIWCFNGTPFCVWACFNRHKDSVEVATYDLEWNFHPEWSMGTKHYVISDVVLPKPKSLAIMLESASILSKGHPQVRVDMYEVGGKVYFGELTFTSAGGFMNFYTRKFLREMGDLVDLSSVAKKFADKE